MVDVATEFSFNLFDIIVGTVLLTFAVLAAYRGFVPELLSMLVWVSSILITLYFVGDMAEAMLPFLKTPFAATIFATLGTLTLSFFTFSAINNHIVKKYMRPHEDIGKLDNMVGFVFGALKGWLIIVLGFILMTVIYGTNREDYPEWVINSYTLPVVERTVALLARRTPDYLPVPSTDLSTAERSNGKKEEIETIVTIPPSSEQEDKVGQ